MEEMRKTFVKVLTMGVVRLAAMPHSAKQAETSSPAISRLFLLFVK